MPAELAAKFKNSENIHMDIMEEFKLTVRSNLKAKTIIDKSLDQHARMCVENTIDLVSARRLSKELIDDIEFRIKQYCSCLGNVSKNYRSWLIEDYITRLTVAIGKIYRIKLLSELD